MNTFWEILSNLLLIAFLVFALIAGFKSQYAEGAYFLAWAILTRLRLDNYDKKP